MVKVIVIAVKAKINVFFFIMLLNDSRPTRAGHWVKCRNHLYIARQYSDFFYFIARRALSTAITVTPTSAKTASHMVATPKAARIRNSSFTPRANAMF